MATRFGGASPTYAYTIKVRYIVGCLFLIILVLGITLVVVLQRQGEPAAVPADNTQAFNQGPASVSPKVDVLVAQQRIEESTPLDKSLFTSIPWDPEQLPDGVILWREADAVLPNKFAKAMITANMPITREMITDQRPNTVLKIPPGFRAVTITVDARSGVEGWARPNTRVDVLCTYTDPKDQKKKIATIARFVKILSVSGQTQAGMEGRAAVAAATTITLLVEEKTSKKVELARKIGELSLALVGDIEPEQTNGTGPDVIDPSILFGTNDQPLGQPAEVPAEGRMVVKDPKTGRPVTMLLRHGRWERDESGL